MARNDGRLAGLAALGALGYMLSQKDKGQPTDQTPGPGRQSLGAGYDSYGTNTGSATDLQTPAQSIAAADKSVGSSASPVMRGETGTTTLGPAYNEPAKTNINSDAATPKPPKTATPKSKSTSLPRGVMGGARQPDAVGLPSGIMGGATQPPAQSTFKADDYYRDVSGKIKRKSASEEKPAASTMRNPRTGRSMSTFNKGGAVKKMASGGMTSKPSSASKRADGIASRGKTNCKMY
jgi:hypothetical protein